MDVSNRSQLARGALYRNTDFTVIDIIPGENVDVVGDAHELSTLFPAEQFDAVLSVSVFEHLLMPWRVVIEMNHVMRSGAVGLIHTHQALGMHDVPCDYWRFSSDCWDALFNSQTGFQIVHRAMSELSYVLPFIYRPEKYDAEQSAGFEDSVVLVRKIGNPVVSWPVKPDTIVRNMYPA